MKLLPFLIVGVGAAWAYICWRVRIEDGQVVRELTAHEKMRAAIQSLFVEVGLALTSSIEQVGAALAPMVVAMAEAAAAAEEYGRLLREAAERMGVQHARDLELPDGWRVEYDDRPLLEGDE